MKPSEDQWAGISGEGHNWEWTPERQQEMSDHYEQEDKVKRMAESIDKTNAQHYGARMSRGER